MQEILISFPSMAWLLAFFCVPTLIIFAFAFKPHDIYGNLLEGVTFEIVFSLFKKEYFFLIFRTLWYSFTATLICILLALPVGYYLIRVPKKIKNLLLLLIVIPFWSNFLIRIFAWKTLLHPEGILKKTLVFLHILSEDASLLYNSGVVIFIMVYSYLPFAILPIYSAASKFNFHLFEAAMDLGASRLVAFYRVFLPSIKKGLLTAAIMVFVPAVGAYVIPDLVGGTNNEMIGNKIAQRTFVERNLPEASALSSLLALLVLATFGAAILTQRRSKSIDVQLRNRE